MKLAELGEDGLLQRLIPNLAGGRDVVAGAGDDCAIVRFGDARELLVLKTDCTVEGVHFKPDAKPQAIGWKAMARPLSDFAAMSAVPQFALVTVIAPPATSVAWVTRLYRGLEKAAAEFGVAVVGGETSSTAGPVSISVNVSGFVERHRWVSRFGGKAGDELFVTGRLGGSGGGKHLRFTPRIAESRWLTKNFDVHAMMDLSDGLGADLPRLARASRVGFELDETALPRNRGCTIAEAIGNGEDYELLFAMAPRAASPLQRRWPRQFPALGLTRIGRLTSVDTAPQRKLRGYVHFAQH